MAGKFTVAVNNDGTLAKPFNAGGALDFIDNNGIAKQDDLNDAKDRISANETNIGENIKAINAINNTETGILAKAKNYTDGEIDKLESLIAAIKTFSVKVVDELPETGEEKVIYLVPATNTEDKNVSDEYLYIKNEDTGKWEWEQIGTTDINLNEELKPIYTELKDLENMMPEVIPNLNILPTITMTSNKVSNGSLYYVGEEVEFGTITTNFNSGKIDPQGQSESPYRCGALTSVTYSGPGWKRTKEEKQTEIKQSYSFTNTIEKYTVSNTSTISWTATASYDGGKQPVSNKGKNYGEPLPAGTKTATLSITGTYPWYAVTSIVDTWTKQPKQKINNSYYEVKFITVGSGKHQKVAFDNTFLTIKAIAALNTFSGNWEWVGGNADTSINAFTKSTETIESRTCNVYTRKEDNTGEASYRFCTNTNKSNLNK